MRDLKTIRKALHLKQIEVAGLCGVSPSTYRRWEWGKQFPRVPHLQRLARAFNMREGDLL